MQRTVLPVLLAMPLAAIVAPAMAAGTLTATSDNRSGTIFANNGSGDPEQSGYNTDASEVFDPQSFNQCVNDTPAKACLNTSSAFIGLAGGNVVTGFSIDSVLTATKNTSSANSASADEDALIGFKVTGASAGDPYKLRIQGGRTGTLGSFSVKFKNASNAVIFSAPATGTFDTTLDLVNGDYTLEIAANLTANGTSVGGTFDYSVDVTKVVPTPGCGVQGSGDCEVAHGTPFCDDAACCTLICSFDPFCCQSSWDSDCASEANASCYPAAVAGPIIDPISGRTHRLFSSGAWSVANALAAGTGENLVTLRNARENEWIRANLLNNVPGLAPAEAWIGLNDVVVEGTFAWDSGLPVTFTAWNAGEPNNNGNGEDFIAMKQATGRWNDLPTSSARRAVTEIANPVCGTGGSCFSTHSPGCNDEACCNLICGFDPFCCETFWDSTCVAEANDFCATAIAAGPFINPKTKHKYYVTTSGAWSTAQGLAMEMGGHLGIPNNAAENEWIRLNLANAAVGTTQLWLGAHDQLVEGSFQTVLGPLTSYTKWANGEPNNSNNEDFVILSNPATGTWNDVPNLLELRAVIEVPCTGDLNDDGKVDGSDLGVLLGAWATGAADLTLDGVTDGADLGVMLGGWGTCATSNCCSSHGTPSCDQPACTTCVCELDPFCCDNSWDSICVGEASDECNAACQCGA